MGIWPWAKREFKLSSFGRGVCCGSDGLSVDGIAFLKRTQVLDLEYWEPRDCSEISEELGALYDLPVDVSSKAAGLSAVARELNAGHIAQAQLIALHLEFPSSPPLAKSASDDDKILFIRALHVSHLLKIDWNPDDHPRWPAGSPDSEGGEFAPKDEGEGGEFAEGDDDGSADGGFIEAAAVLSARDRAYLDGYYPRVSELARKYGVDPALVLGVGIESGFGTKGTYLRTKDAFGMTGGSTAHMEYFNTPEENVDAWFRQWGEQIRDAGSDVDVFVNGLQGLDASGAKVIGWKKYNTETEYWASRIRSGIRQMQRDLPLYDAQSSPTEPI